jgi:hypothetical protein
MKNYLLSLLGNYHTNDQQQSSDRELLDAVHAAQLEWYAAQSYFENVSDPELVDYAIYKMEAAKRRYMYLLKAARKEGLEDNRAVQQIKKSSQA